MKKSIRIIIRTIISATRNILWRCYYVYDLLKCAPHKNKVKITDHEIAEKVSKCVVQRNPEKIIIFAVYEKKLDDEYISFFLKSVGHALTIVINNTDQNKYGVEHFDKSLIWVNRPNFGRDIAAYKLGVHSVVLSDLKSLEDLSLINDSWYILKASLFNFFRDNFPEDVLAHSFSQRPYPHARSYLLRIKQPLLDSLNGFLINFPMAKSRYNAVINGEIGMSKAIFIKYKIGLWAHSGVLTGELNNESLVSDAVSTVAFMRDFLNDPYEISRNSISYVPDLIKKEMFEKALVTKETVCFVIENSQLPKNLKKNALTDILIRKRHFGIKNLLKLAIGEI